MSDEPKGTILTDIFEHVCLKKGTPVNTLLGGKQVLLTRKLAIAQALEESRGVQDKEAAYNLSNLFSEANGQISVTHEEAAMIKLAVKEIWGQPGICVPLCRWLEGA